MKRLILLAALGALLGACHNNDSPAAATTPATDSFTASVQAEAVAPASETAEPKDIDSVNVAASESAEPVAVP